MQPHRQGKPLPLRDSHRLMLAAMATSSVPGNRQWVALANTELGSLASSGLAGLQRAQRPKRSVSREVWPHYTHAPTGDPAAAAANSSCSSRFPY